MSLSLLGALATFTGGIAGASSLIGVPALFGFALVCSLMRVRGDVAATSGVLALIMFCITEGTPAPLAASTLRGLLFAAGTLEALFISLALWPFRPYQPVRKAVAACWTAIAELSGSLARLAAGHGSEWDDLVKLRRQAREALERARHALGVARTGRQGETGRGLQLLVLYEIAELALGDLAALSEALRWRSERAEPAAPDVLEAIAALGRMQLAVAEVVIERPHPAPSAKRAAVEGEIGTFLERLEAETAQAVETAEALQSGGQAARGPGALPPPDQEPSLRDALAFESAELRHALRVAITVAAAALLSQALKLQRSYWVTVTVVIVLQPHAIATVRRALQRVAGTVVGGIVAALLARAVHPLSLLAPVLFGMSWVAVAVRRMNYALFAALLTPVFVLLAESAAGGSHLTRVRILDTLLGGALGLAGALLLWPTREMERLPALFAAVLRANQEYLQAVLRGGPPAPAVAARRRIGLATANAEAALQRLIGEGHPPDRIEPAMAMVAYARRLSASITALGASPPPPEAAERLDRILGGLACSAEAGEPPPAIPPLESAALPEAAQRLLRQLRVVQSALARVAAR